jgi:hypothetical protein
LAYPQVGFFEKLLLIDIRKVGMQVIVVKQLLVFYDPRRLDNIIEGGEVEQLKNRNGVKNCAKRIDSRTDLQFDSFWPILIAKQEPTFSIWSSSPSEASDFSSFTSVRNIA